MSKLLDRVADAGGIAFVVLVGVGDTAFVAPFMPESLDAPDQVVRHLQANPVTTTFWVGVAMESLGLLALVLLAARLAERVRRAGDGGWLPAAIVGTAVAAFAVKLGSFAPSLAALHVDRYDAGTVTALLDINDAAYDVSWASMPPSPSSSASPPWSPGHSHGGSRRGRWAAASRLQSAWPSQPCSTRFSRLSSPG